MDLIHSRKIASSSRFFGFFGDFLGDSRRNDDKEEDNEGRC
jgi:hypothetical protein